MALGRTAPEMEGSNQAMSIRAEDLVADIEVRPAWMRGDAKIEADALALWDRLGVLPDDVDPARRAKELVAAAYKEGVLIAVATARIEHIAFLRARLAVLRSLTDPAHRRGHVQVALTAPVKKELEDWAAAHPEEKLAGVIGFVERGIWGDLARMPVTPPWPLTLAAYTEDGQQVRLAWFDHFRVD